jgi:hypothetical protein
MLTAAALVALLAWALLLAGLIARVADRFERRRLERVAAEIQVTQAVHEAMGPIVAPTLARHRGRQWTITIGLPPRDFASAGRLTEIVRQALGQGSAGARVVFVPRSGP